MTNVQILALKNLENNPSIDAVSVSFHKTFSTVFIHSEAEKSEVIALVKEVFPDMAEEYGSILYSRSTNTHINIVSKEKTPVIETEDKKENTQLDYSSIDELVAREA